MQTLRRLLLLVSVVFCSLTVAHVQAKHKAAKPKPVSCSQGTSYRGCPACGTAKDNKHRTLNVQKNRGTAVTSPKKITVQEIRDPANDTKFTPSKQVWVIRYVKGIHLNCSHKKKSVAETCLLDKNLVSLARSRISCTV